jgi:hypothetical protein
MDAAREELTSLLYSYATTFVFHTHAAGPQSVSVHLRPTEPPATPLPRFVCRCPSLPPAVVEPATLVTGFAAPR